MPKSSTLVRLEDENFEDLCNFLNQSKECVIVPPERIGNSYRSQEMNEEYYMLFSFAGALGDYFPIRQTPSHVDNPLSMAIALRRQLIETPKEVFESMKNACKALPAFDFNNLKSTLLAAIHESGLGGFCSQVYNRLLNYDRKLEDALVHNDMQTGNMVMDGDGQRRIVDIDLMRTGTAYSDLLTCALYIGASPKELKIALLELEKINARSLNQFDIDFSVGSTLLWLKTISSMKYDMPKHQLSRYLKGLITVASIYDSKLRSGAE